MCAQVAAFIGLSELYVPEIVNALTKAAKRPNVLWLSQGICTGCTESIAQSEYPDPAQIVLDLISMNYWETLMAGAGDAAEKSIQDTIKNDKGKYLVVVEGAIERGWNGNALRIRDKTGLEVLKEVSKDAAAVIAVGSCAFDGGWVAAGPNQSDATGVMQVIGPDKVVNLPTCPVNPEWLVAVLVDYMLLGKLPELDALRRPVGIYGETIHDNCPRRGHFERGEFVSQFGSAEEAKNFCLYKMGCKGPTTDTNCPVVRWNAKVSWCVESGSPCIGCGSPNWVDNNAPFFSRLAAINLPGIGGTSPDTIGKVIGAATVVGLGAHLVGQIATGRMGKGGPREGEGGGE